MSCETDRFQLSCATSEEKEIQPIVLLSITYCAGERMSVKSVQFTVAAHVMAALGYFQGEEISSATLADSVNADPTFVRKSLSKLSKAGLVVTKRGKSGATDHAARHIPCQCSAAGICDSFVSGRQEVSGQLPPQGVHVGPTFSGSEQLREIAGENNPGSSGWSDPGKGAVTFFDFNCADKKNNT
jgi:hypothetical protein